MINNLMYIELKTGYSDDGPAWIGYVKTSKSKKTIYFNDHAFQKNIGNYANYIDIENGDKYWLSGLKKEESNRHWAGHGKIMIDRRAVNEYLFLIGEKVLPLNLFEVVDIEDRFPVKRVKELLNEKKQQCQQSCNIENKKIVTLSHMRANMIIEKVCCRQTVSPHT